MGFCQGLLCERELHCSILCLQLSEPVKYWYITIKSIPQVWAKDVNVSQTSYIKPKHSQTRVYRYSRFTVAFKLQQFGYYFLIILKGMHGFGH